MRQIRPSGFWVPDAVTYDEEPNSFSLSLRQRRRWCSGIMDVARAELPSLWSAWRQAPSLLIIDSMANLIFPFVQALSVIPLLLTLFSMNLVSALMLSAGSLALTYVGTAALGFIASQGEQRTLKAILCYPLFMAELASTSGCLPISQDHRLEANFPQPLACSQARCVFQIEAWSLPSIRCVYELGTLPYTFKKSRPYGPALFPSIPAGLEWRFS